MAIEEAIANNGNYSAVANADKIQEVLVDVLEKDKAGLDGKFTIADTEEANKIAIKYVGNDYKNATNNTDAEIIYTIELGKGSIELVDEENSTLKDENGNDLEIDIGGNTEGGIVSEGAKIADVVKVGDYINYGAKLTSKIYDTDTTETGYTDPQKFQTNTSMSWRVISKNADRSVNIVATENVLATDNETGLYLSGQKGFLNAETVLKNLCNELYTNLLYGEARSINDSDINALTGFDPVTSEWTGYIKIKEYYNGEFTYTTGGPFWDKATDTFKTPNETNTGSIKVVYDMYSYIVNESMPLYDTLISESTTYSGNFSEENYPLFYWLGSRCAMPFENYSMHCVNSLGKRRYFRSFNLLCGS